MGGNICPKDLFYITIIAMHPTSTAVGAQIGIGNERSIMPGQERSAMMNDDPIRRILNASAKLHRQDQPF
jgi:hypothetical protein